MKTWPAWSLLLALAAAPAVARADTERGFQLAALRRIPRARPIVDGREGPSRRPRQRLLSREQIEALIRAEHGDLTGPIFLRGAGRLQGMDGCPCVEYQTRDAAGQWVRGRIETALEGSPLAATDRVRVHVHVER